MPKGSWTSPPIFSVLLLLQKRLQLAKAEEINKKLKAAKAVLESQLLTLKKQQNGK
jgi:hypothetical protein